MDCMYKTRHCFLFITRTAKVLFFVFAVFLCSCETSVVTNSLYDEGRELEENGDAVLAEIVRQNPEIRELVHVTQYDYMTKTNKRNYPDAVIQQKKASYFIVLVLPRDFSFTSGKMITTRECSSSHQPIDFPKQLLSNMSTTENASLLDDIEYANSYVSCTDDAFYYVDIYKISGYSLVLIDISKSLGVYSKSIGE